MKKTLLAGCVAACLWPLMPATAANIRAYTEALPPLNFAQDGRVTGFASDLLREMAAEAGHSVQLR